MNARKLSAIGACMLLGATALTGCSAADSGTSEAKPTSDHAGVSASGLLDNFRGVQYDYEPFPTPSALERRSDLVVKAGAIEVIPGREEVFAEGLSTTRLALRVKIVEVYADSNANVQAGDEILVELPNAGDMPATEYDELAAPGLEYVLYLDRATNLPRVTQDNLEAADGPLFTPTNPQSVWVGDGNEVVQLLDEVVVPGTVEEASPEESEFPSQPQ